MACAVRLLPPDEFPLNVMRGMALVLDGSTCVAPVNIVIVDSDQLLYLLQLWR